MRSGIRQRLEMFARVRSFGRTHPSTDPEHATVLGRFEERLARAETIATRQFDGLAAEKSARFRRSELRKVVHFQLLRYLVAVAGVAARTRTELAERFKLPDNHAANLVFLTSVKSMLALAETQRDALVSEGMAPRLLEDLAGMVAEFEAAIEAARAARIDHIGARADMEEAVSELLGLVKLLDGIYRWRFGKDPELLVEWNAAKHVPGLPSRVTPPPVVEGDGEVPPGSGAAPAA